MSIKSCIIGICLLLVLFCGRAQANALSSICFPENFTFGIASSGCHGEGAWNVLDKYQNVRNYYTYEHPTQISNYSNTETVTDVYHVFKKDVDILENPGVQLYSFSISWSRVLPTGFSNEINNTAIEYYRELIEELTRLGMQPMVAMSRLDLPQTLQDLGGWTNPEIADYYVDYARVLFEALGDQVLTWLTFNGPLAICLPKHGEEGDPGEHSSGWESYLCGHNVLRAHGAVYRMYKQEYYPTQRGRVGIAVEAMWMEPATTSPKDRAAAEIARQFYVGWFTHPIFSKEGDYPVVMRKQIDNMSKRQKFLRTRLPTFSKEELKMIRGSSDFLGLSSFTTYLASPLNLRTSNKYPSFEEDTGVVLYQNPIWPKSSSKRMRVISWGFRRVLNWIKDSYNNPATIVVANVVPAGPRLNDRKRLQYLDGYLRSLHAAITRDGCRVQGYAYCSLMDSSDLIGEYTERFGLYEVDFVSAERSSHARLSATYFRQLAATKCLPDLTDLIQKLQQ